MAQTEEFMFQNVAYRPTVYRTGVSGYAVFRLFMGLGGVSTNTVATKAVSTLVDFSLCTRFWGIPQNS